MDQEQIRRYVEGLINGYREATGGPRCGPHLSEKPVLKLAPDELARLMEIQSKLDGLERDMRRIGSKIQAEGLRFWLDVKDRHGMHGRGELVYSREDGEVYEVLGR